METYADLATSGDLLNGVISELGLDLDVGSLASKIDSEVVPSTSQIKLIVTDRDPTVAQTINTALSKDLADYLAEVGTPTGTTGSQIIARVTDPADHQADAVTPRTMLDLMVAGLIGLVLGVGLAVARDVLDRSVSSLEHVEEVSTAPVLASIGFDNQIKKSPLLTDLGAFASRTEAFRLLRTNLQFLDLEQQPRSLVITSAVPGEGKTVTAANLAVALAQAGRNAVVHAYEASPSTARWLERNVRDNHLTGRVTAHAVAVSDHDGTLELADNVHASALNGLTSPEGSLVTVPCRTFAGVVADAGGQVDLVKLDTEGAEYAIVLGSRPDDWAGVRTLVMECHDVPGHSWAELAEFLGEAGLAEVAHEPAGPRQGTVWLRRAD